jgi:hypothetical protein
MSKKNPQNGATFTKGKPVRRPPTVANPGREAAQREIDTLDAARRRSLDKLFHTDKTAFLQELGLLKGK